MEKQFNRMLLLLAVIGLIALGVAVAEPVRSALQIGIDEHFEVTKANLVAHGYKLYRDVWNDQPPLHTLILSQAFKWFGANILVARLVAVAFGLSLLAGTSFMVYRRQNGLAAFVAVFCMIASPQVLELCISPMLEVPAIGTALWALWPILRWQKSGQWPWLLASGALLAAALQIKLTAVVVAPALAVEILLERPSDPGWKGLSQRLTSLALWGAAVAVCYAALVVAFGTVPLDVLWASHFSPDTLARSGMDMPLLFPRVLWQEHFDAFCTAGVALLLAVVQRDWQVLAFPLSWLLTASLVHLHHRPWWPYYYLHFAVPLAWLSGEAVAIFGRLVVRHFAIFPIRFFCSQHLGLAAASLMMSMLAVFGGDRLAFLMARIQSQPHLMDFPVLLKMRQHASQTRWVYSRDTIFVFHAGLMVIPELAVLPQKRFWSRQVTEQQVWSTVRRYRPEQILVSNGNSNQSEIEATGLNYNSAFKLNSQCLYIR